MNDISNLGRLGAADDACAVADDLAQEHEALMQFVYMAPVGLLQARSDGDILMMNPVAAQLLMPLARDGALVNLFDALQDVAPDLRYRLAAFSASHGMVCDGIQLPAGGGHGGTGDRRLLSLGLLKLDADRVMALLQDVTLQARRERLLAQHEAWLNAILSSVSGYALVGLDTAGRVVEWNASIGRLTGFDAGAVVGRLFSVFCPDDATTADRVIDRLNEAEHSGWSLDDGWRQRADGSRFWGSALIAPLRLVRHHLASSASADAAALQAEGEAAYCLILRDLSEHRDAAEQARHAAVCDHLTGIGNRRAFFDGAEVELRRARQRPRPLSVVMFDADHFKRINDRHGHAAGDAVLRHIGGLLQQTFRQIDLVARIGGEEFAVLLPSTAIAAAHAAAERFCGALAAAPVATEAGPLYCTVSAGVTCFDGGAGGVEQLLKQADDALYAAKAAGRNAVRSWQAPVALDGTERGVPTTCADAAETDPT